MNKFIDAVLKFAVLISIILGVILISIGGLLIFAPKVIFSIIKFLIVGLCIIGGTALIVISSVVGLIYLKNRKNI